MAVDRGVMLWLQVLLTGVLLAVSVWTGTRPTKTALETRRLLKEGASAQGLVTAKHHRSEESPQVWVWFYTDATPGVPGDNYPFKQYMSPVAVPGSFPVVGVENGRIVGHEAYSGATSVPSSYYDSMNESDRVIVRYLPRDPATFYIPAAWPRRERQTNWIDLVWAFPALTNLLRLIRVRLTA